VSDSEQVWSYDHLELGTNITDYLKDTELSSNQVHYLISLMFQFNFMKRYWLSFIQAFENPALSQNAPHLLVVNSAHRSVRDNPEMCLCYLPSSGRSKMFKVM
jgi:hypothetical protein